MGESVSGLPEARKQGVLHVPVIVGAVLGDYPLVDRGPVPPASLRSTHHGASRERARLRSTPPAGGETSSRFFVLCLFHRFVRRPPFGTKTRGWNLSLW